MEDHKLALEILIPLTLMMGWMWRNLSKQIQENRIEIRNLDRRLQKIENRLEFSNKVVYVQHEDLKKN